MKKNVVIIIVMLALLVVLALYVGRTPVEDFEAGTQELVVAETAVSHTITVDDHISLDGAVLFPFDSTVLSDDGKAIIDERIVKYRGKVQDTLDIDVTGYADNIGADDYNQALSEERAQAVADYIDAQTDIPHKQIKVRGKGASESEGESAEDRAIDRRVIINVTGKLLDQE